MESLQQSKATLANKYSDAVQEPYHKHEKALVGKFENSKISKFPTVGFSLAM